MSSEEKSDQSPEMSRQQHAQLMEKLEEMTIGLERLVKLQAEAVQDQEALGRLVKLIVWMMFALLLMSLYALLFRA